MLSYFSLFFFGEVFIFFQFSGCTGGVFKQVNMTFPSCKEHEGTGEWEVLHTEVRHISLILFTGQAEGQVNWIFKILSLLIQYGIINNVSK